MSRAIFRYEVPVDDQWHEIDLTGPIVYVALRDPSVVEFWAWHTDGPAVTSEFRVFGTGHPLPAGPLTYRGSVVTAGGHLVWHLMEGGSAPAEPK